MRVVEQVPFGKRYASLITDVDIFRRIRDAYGVLPNLMQELKSHQELQQRPHLFTCRYTTDVMVHVRDQGGRWVYRRHFS